MKIIKGQRGLFRFFKKPKPNSHNSSKTLLNKNSTGYKIYVHSNPTTEFNELVKLSKDNMDIDAKRMYRIRLFDFKSKYPTYSNIKWIEHEFDRISSELSNESVEESMIVLLNLEKSKELAKKQGFSATISYPTVEHTTDVDLYGKDISNLYGNARPIENYINLNDKNLPTQPLKNSILIHESNHVFHGLNPIILKDPKIQKILNDAYLSNLSMMEKAATNALIRDYVTSKGLDPETYEYIKVDSNNQVSTIYQELVKDLGVNDVNISSLHTVTINHLRNSKDKKGEIDKLNEAMRIAVSTVPAVATAAWIMPWQENDKQITQYKMGGKLIPKHRFLKDGGVIAKGLDAWNAITINGTSYTLDGLKGDTFIFKDNKRNKILISKNNLKNYYLNLNYQNNEFYLKIKSDELDHRYNFTDEMYEYIENPKITKQKERKAKQERKAKRKLNSLSVRDKVYQKKQEAQSAVVTPQTKSEIEDKDLAKYNYWSSQPTW